MIELYNFDDLDSKARERAMSQVAEYVNLCEPIIDNLIEIFRNRLETLGYPISDVVWQPNNYQDDSVAFYGRLDSSQLQILRDRLMPELPDSEIELLEMNIEQTNSYNNPMGLSYTHHGSMCEAIEQFAKNITDDIIDVSKKLEQEGYEMLEYSKLEKAMLDYAESKRIEFTQDGDIFAIRGRLWN